MCEASFSFGKFLCDYINDTGVCNIVIWSDETTSGNQLRTDQRRTFLSFYWTICELPGFFKSSDHGWWPIGILSNDVVHDVAGQASGIMKAILRHFFIGDCSFTSGIRVQLCGTHRTIKGRLAAVLQDEKGHKYVGSVKGASGTKCCLMCCNVLNIKFDKVCGWISCGKGSVFHPITPPPPPQLRVHIVLPRFATRHGHRVV